MPNAIFRTMAAGKTQFWVKTWVGSILGPFETEREAELRAQPEPPAPSPPPIPRRRR
jgi:hypothetical protein